MVNLKKKVIIFIVEGPSDKAALGTIFQNYFSTDEVRFLVIHGDITTEPHVSRDNIISRNECKKGILTKLYLTGKVCESLCEGGIKYRVYYNSCNLEHVLYGELKAFTEREKEELADDFAEKYEDDVEAFVAFITNPEFAVMDSYRKTWAFIEKDLNSLKRHSNLGLVFDGE